MRKKPVKHKVNKRGKTHWRGNGSPKNKVEGISGKARPSQTIDYIKVIPVLEMGKDERPTTKYKTETERKLKEKKNKTPTPEKQTAD